MEEGSVDAAALKRKSIISLSKQYSRERSLSCSESAILSYIEGNSISMIDLQQLDVEADAMEDKSHKEKIEKGKYGTANWCYLFQLNYRSC